jgi:hypothetical protein
MTIDTILGEEEVFLPAFKKEDYRLFSRHNKIWQFLILGSLKKMFKKFWITRHIR